MAPGILEWAAPSQAGRQMVAPVWKCSCGLGANWTLSRRVPGHRVSATQVSRSLLWEFSCCPGCSKINVKLERVSTSKLVFPKIIFKNELYRLISVLVSKCDLRLVF